MTEQLISFKTAMIAKKVGFNWILGFCATQSLLQKWLREEHNLYVNHLLSPAGIYIEIFKYGKCILTLGADGGYLNYEEALEIGLQEALKLI